MLDKILPLLLPGFLMLWNFGSTGTPVSYMVNGKPEVVHMEPWETKAIPVPAGQVLVRPNAVVRAWAETSGARVDAVEPSKLWRFPVVPRTGLALVNPHEEPVLVAFRIFYDGHYLTFSGTLAPKAQFAAFLPAWLSVDIQAGTLALESNKPIVAFAASCPSTCYALPHN